MSKSAELYGNLYKDGIEWESFWLKLTSTPKIESVITLAAKVPQPINSVCDIGSGTGAVLEGLLQQLPAKQWYAVDGSEDALAYLRTHLGARVQLRRVDFETGAAEIPSCTLGIASHVLEHLERPEDLLKKLHGKFNFLIVEVPLLDNIIPRVAAGLRKLLLGRDKRDNTAGHIQFWTRTSFRKMLQDAGWQPVGDREYLPYFKEFLIVRARHSGQPIIRALLPYYAYSLLGPFAKRLAVTHYAVLLRRRESQSA